MRLSGSNNGVLKLTPLEKRVLRDGVPSATTQPPRRRKTWVQTAIVGFVAARMPRNASEARRLNGEHTMETTIPDEVVTVELQRDSTLTEVVEAVKAALLHEAELAVPGAKRAKYTGSLARTGRRQLRCYEAKDDQGDRTQCRNSCK
ncbi:hypothetical protein PRIC1_004648 [Phytophthora ramorum]